MTLQKKKHFKKVSGSENLKDHLANYLTFFILSLTDYVLGIISINGGIDCS